MDIKTYLESPEAEREVRALLGKGGTIALTLDVGPDNLTWCSHAHGPWRRVVLRLGWGDCSEVAVYFRPEGASEYVVTDLGEAVRALRLRTGVLKPDVPLNVHAAFITSAKLHLQDGMLWGEFPAADLHRALCQALLAVLQVSQLEVTHG